MDAVDAAALRRAWGNKPCEHPWWVKETLNEEETGVEVCTTCGNNRPKGEVKKSKWPA